MYMRVCRDTRDSLFIRHSFIIHLHSSSFVGLASMLPIFHPDLQTQLQPHKPHHWVPEDNETSWATAPLQVSVSSPLRHSKSTGDLCGASARANARANACTTKDTIQPNSQEQAMTSCVQQLEISQKTMIMRTLHFSLELMPATPVMTRNQLPLYTISSYTDAPISVVACSDQTLVKVVPQTASQSKAWLNEFCAFDAIARNHQLQRLVVPLHWVYIDDLNKQCFLGMEHARGGDLHTYVCSWSVMPQTERVLKIMIWVTQLLAGVHRAGWVHGDWSMENILLKQTPPRRPGDLMVGDVETMRSLTDRRPYSALCKSELRPPEYEQCFSQMTPKMTRRMDRWQLGCMLYSMGAQTHFTSAHFIRMAERQECISFDDQFTFTFTPNMQRAILGLLRVNPRERISARRALSFLRERQTLAPRGMV